MQNPIDILGVHPKGALPRRIDPRDYKYASSEVAGATVSVFDWSVGYDVENDISHAIGLGFQLPTKDQGQAGSCGGEAISAYGQAITAYFLKERAEKSAKAPYAQVCVPGGGSNDKDLANIYVKQGIYKEALVPSYPSLGVPPTEAFMERVGDISPAARIDAAKEAAMVAYSFPSMDIDTIAGVVRDCKGVVLGLYGTNNGTWLSMHPKPPTSAELASGQGVWSHYMFGGKAFVVNGKKTIFVKQSWGNKIPNNGWQMLDEDYFRSGAIWSAMALIVSDKPASVPTHVFAHDIHHGETSSEVTALQTFLAYDGCFNLPPTGYYGPITAQAVLRFQIKYGLASVASLEQLGGNSVGPLTRTKLNSLTK